MNLVLNPNQVTHPSDGRRQNQLLHNHHTRGIHGIQAVTHPHSNWVTPEWLIGGGLPRQEPIGRDRHSRRSLQESIFQELLRQVDVSSPNQRLQLESLNHRQFRYRCDDRDFVQFGGDHHHAVGGPDIAITHGDQNLIRAGSLTLARAPSEQPLLGRGHANGALHDSKLKRLPGYIGVEPHHDPTQFITLDHLQFRGQFHLRRFINLSNPQPETIGYRCNPVAHPPRNPHISRPLRLCRSPLHETVTADRQTFRTTGQSKAQKLNRHVHIGRP